MSKFATKNYQRTTTKRDEAESQTKQIRIYQGNAARGPDVGVELATPPGFEPGTSSLEGCCSIHLSYGVARRIYHARCG
jgi:hypothetical protein